MKIGVVVSLVGLLAFVIAGCHGQDRGDFVVLPDGYRSAVCLIDNGTLVPIQELPFPGQAAVPAETRRPIDATDSIRVIAAAYDYIEYAPSGWITYTADLGRVFMVVRYDPENGVVRHNDIRMPEGICAGINL